MKIIILGAGRVGQSVADSLVSEHNDITVIDTDGARLRDLESRLDLRGVVGNGIQPSVLLDAGAKDADVLLYNSTIEGSIASTEQLVEKCPLLAQFKAVQNGNVWCTAQSLFQQSTELPDLILDMNRVFTEGTPADSELTFLTHVE